MIFIILFFFVKIDDSYNLSICLLDDYKEKNSIGLTTKRSEYKQYLSKYLNTSISTVELKKLPFLQRYKYYHFRFRLI